MGWLWSSSLKREGGVVGDAGVEADVAKKSGLALREEQRKRIFGKSGALRENDKTCDNIDDKVLEPFQNSLSQKTTGLEDVLEVVGTRMELEKGTIHRILAPVRENAREDELSEDKT